jgi:hypothetical protein
MTIHEQDPASHLQLIIDLHDGLFSLSTTKRHLFAFLSHVHLGSEAFETSVGISSLGKYENEGSGEGTFFERASNIEHGRRDEFISNVLTDIVLDSKGDLVKTEALEEDHLLERVKLFIPLSR